MDLLKKLNISGLHPSEFDLKTQREYGSEIFKNYSSKTNNLFVGMYHYSNESLLLMDNNGDIVFIGLPDTQMCNFLNRYNKNDHKWQNQEQGV